MKNKKGFTLVELLAVIVLLGLLAILITPKITETLKKQKKAIFTNSVEGIVNAINNDIADDSSISTEMSQYRAYEFDVNKLYLIVEDNMSKDESIEISGNIKNGTGRVVVTDVNKIALAITDGKYCAKKGANERNIKVTEMGAEDKCELEEGIFNEGSSCFIFEENPDETLTITGYDYNNSSCSKELVIPNRINGKTVTKIKEGAFFDYDRTNYKLAGTYKYEIKDASGNLLETAWLVEYYENIPSDAEVGLYFLTKDEFEIVPHKNTDTIKPSILGETSEFAPLENMNAPLRVATRYCYNIETDTETKVDINYKDTPDDAYDFCYLYTPNYDLVNIYKITSLDLSKNYNIKEIPDLLLPGSSLKTLNLGSSVTKIGISSFSNNIISTLKFSNNITTINNSAFYDNSISSLDLSKLTKLEYIGGGVFYRNGITTISFDKNTALKYIGESAFADNYISSISFKNAANLEYIGDYAFDRNYVSGEINLLDSKKLNYLGYRSFRTLTDDGIDDVYLPSNISYIDNYVFEIYGDCGEPDIHVSKETDITYNTIINNDPIEYVYETEDDDYHHFIYIESMCR